MDNNTLNIPSLVLFLLILAHVLAHIPFAVGSVRLWLLPRSVTLEEKELFTG